MSQQSSFEARLMLAQIKALEYERDRKETLREFLHNRIDAINEALSGGVRLKDIHQEVMKEGYVTAYSTFY
jgi:hypothetical protein